MAIGTGIGQVAAIAGGVLLLAGCGHGGGGTGGWGDGTKACDILDKSVVAGALGTSVSKTELTEVEPPEDGRASKSICVYTLADQRQAKVTTRVWPETSNTPEAMAEARKQLLGPGGMKEVPGIGKLTVWTDVDKSFMHIHIMSTYIGDRQYADVVLPVGGAPGLAAATTIMHKLGG